MDGGGGGLVAAVIDIQATLRSVLNAEESQMRMLIRRVCPPPFLFPLGACSRTLKACRTRADRDSAPGRERELQESRGKSAPESVPSEGIETLRSEDDVLEDSILLSEEEKEGKCRVWGGVQAHLILPGRHGEPPWGVSAPPGSGLPPIHPSLPTSRPSSLVSLPRG